MLSLVIACLFMIWLGRVTMAPLVSIGAGYLCVLFAISGLFDVDLLTSFIWSILVIMLGIIVFVFRDLLLAISFVDSGEYDVKFGRYDEPKKRKIRHAE